MVEYGSMKKASVSNSRKVLLVSHSICLGAVWLFFKNPHDPGHVFPCFSFLDLPAVAAYYYAGMIVGLLLNIDGAWHLRGQSIYLVLLFLGGLQWYVIGLGIDYWRNRRTPIDSLFCSHCNYDLTGNVSGVCPECGKSLSDRSNDES